MSEENISDDTPAEQSNVENQEQPQPPETSEPEPAKRARGRPVGVKDTVKRTRKKITIVEEAIAPQEVAQPPSQNIEPPPETPEPIVKPDAPEPEVYSPRTIDRVRQGAAAELLTSLRRAKYDDRRENLRNMYSKGLTRINGQSPVAKRSRESTQYSRRSQALPICSAEGAYNW